MKGMLARECKRVRGRISEVVLGDERLSVEDERHAAACLSCQAEIARYRAIDRAFIALQQEVAIAPPGLVSKIMAGLDRPPIPWFRRPGTVSVSAMSAVAVATTVALAIRRRQAAA
ncbi:MAG: hypothetical protein P1T08_10995 [Acidimicrobiia bacterium]|nr:hypothetical protein [Acidimicrobiia bacterium]